MRPPLRNALLALTTAAAAAVAACNAPSVPIPPPEPEAMTFALDAGAGTATFTFDPDPTYAGAVVLVFNRSQGQGVIDTARDDGSVGPTLPFPGADGDDVLITFEVDDDNRATTCVELHDGRSSSNFECDP